MDVELDVEMGVESTVPSPGGWQCRYVDVKVEGGGRGEGYPININITITRRLEVWKVTTLFYYRYYCWVTVVRKANFVKLVARKRMRSYHEEMDIEAGVERDSKRCIHHHQHHHLAVNSDFALSTTSSHSKVACSWKPLDSDELKPRKGMAYPNLP